MALSDAPSWLSHSYRMRLLSSMLQTRRAGSSLAHADRCRQTRLAQSACCILEAGRALARLQELDVYAYQAGTSIAPTFLNTMYRPVQSFTGFYFPQPSSLALPRCLINLLQVSLTTCLLSSKCVLPNPPSRSCRCSKHCKREPCSQSFDRCL